MNTNLVKELLLTNNYWVLNKNLVKMFGLEAAFLLSNFAEAEKMMGDENGWFYQTADTVEEITTLSRHKQDQCIKQLEGVGVLEKDVRGMPAKRYFRFNYTRLANLIVNFLQTSVQIFDKQDCKKSATNKESINKESINKESNKDIMVKNEENEKEIEEKDKIPYTSIISYLNEKCKKRYRDTTPKTRNLIKARWSEGFNLQDFYKVIDIKTKQWLHDEEMSQYLRPETLFGTKFESYLNQPMIMTNQEKQLLKLKQMREKRQPEYEMLGDGK